MKSTLHLINLFCQWLMLFVIGAGAGLFVATRLGYLEPIRPYIVLSGSMAPAISTGSVVVVVPKSTYTFGDIITFSSGGGSDTTTHRLIDIQNVNGQITYITKGDANNSSDPVKIEKKTIIGSVMVIMPYLGYLVDWAKKPQGFILLVIIPATIIVYEELKFLLLQIKNLNHTPQPHNTGAPLPPLPKKTVPPPTSSKAWWVIPVLATTTIFIGLTGSYFFDRETSSGNQLLTATPSANLAP
jgi:signal peptidase I